VKVSILADGKLTEQNLLNLQDKYLKRIKSFKIELTEIPSKLKADKKLQMLQQFINKKMDKNPIKVFLLDEHGKQFTSLKFAGQIKFSIQKSEDIIFVIGGAEGHPIQLKNKYPLFSLSELTLPHMLARVVLIEQLYRAATIIQGHPYHNE
jgi:23S rRNA (pseudouridine1915-N3)-methyltransferase